MPAKRKRIVGDNPLEKETNRPQTLPGDGVGVVLAQANGDQVKKLFAYKLPVPLGTKFKLYCHARGKTAEGVLAEILADFLKDKKIDPFE